MFLLALAIGALAHVSSSVLRRRRGELAVLRSMGLTPRQVRACLAWQATTLAVIGVAIGVPLGIAVGRTAWRLVTDATPMVYTEPVAVLALVLIVPPRWCSPTCSPRSPATAPHASVPPRCCAPSEPVGPARPRLVAVIRGNHGGDSVACTDASWRPEDQARLMGSGGNEKSVVNGLSSARRGDMHGRVESRRHLVRPDRGRPRCATASAAERTTAAATAGRRFAVLLFTDMVDSTELASEIGDARWRQVLDEHDALCARIVTAHGGRVVKQMGDGVLALFEQAGRAVVAALDLRDALAELGLAIRAGLHAAEVELRGDDVAGISVHIAKRIEAAAQPTQVLVSQTVVDLTTGSDISSDPSGIHTLKGVPGEWPLFEVVR